MFPINEIPNGWPEESDEDKAENTGTQAEEIFAAMEAEQREQAILLNHGMEFKTPILLLRWLTPKIKTERTWLLKSLYLGTLDYLSVEFLQLDLSEAAIQENPLPEARRLVSHNAKRCARIVALAYLNHPALIPLFTWFFAWYFRWHLTTPALLQLTIMVQRMSSLGDFTNSIRLMYVMPRTTAPVLIEKPGAEQRV